MEETSSAVVGIVNQNLNVHQETGIQILTSVSNLAMENTGVFLEGNVDIMNFVQEDHVGHNLSAHLIGGVNTDVSNLVMKCGERVVSVGNMDSVRVSIVCQNQIVHMVGGIIIFMNVASLAASRRELLIRVVKDSSVMGCIADQTLNAQLIG